MYFKFFKNISILFLLLLALLYCNTKKTEQSPAETLARIIRADNKGDIETVMSLYTTDAILMPAGKENISGHEAIRKNYEAIFSNSALQLHPRIEEIIQSENIAVIRGTITGKVISKKDTAESIVNDKFLMVLKNESLNWKIYRLVWGEND